jgi:hypothetical protein
MGSKRFASAGVVPAGKPWSAAGDNSLAQVEERQGWRQVEPDPGTDDSQVIPDFYLIVWGIELGAPLRAGKMPEHFYPLHQVQPGARR